MLAPFRLSTTMLLTCALSGFVALAQDPNPSAQEPTAGRWRQFSPSPDETASAQAPAGQEPAAQFADAPGQLTIPAGTWISVRTDQMLSSDHNQPGDAFTATLVQPLVANGRVVARRGQIMSAPSLAGIRIEAAGADRDVI